MAEENSDKLPLLHSIDGGDRGGGGEITNVLIFSILIAVCTSFVGGSTYAYSAPVQSAIISDLGLSTADYSLFGSILTIGGLFGSILCGKITDYVGRKATMGIANILYFVGWLLIAFSQGAWSLDSGRLILGFATSLGDYVVPVYIAEISPKNIRGGLVFMSQLMFFSGIASVLLVGLVTRWRMLALIAMLPCVIQLLGIFSIPESPRWLVNVGRVDDYETTLQWLRGKNMDISQEAADIRCLQDYIDGVENIEGDSFFNVFRLKYAYALTVGLGIMALSSLGGTTGILYYGTAIFESAGFSGTIGTMTMALIQLPPSALGVVMMDKFGRWPLLMYSAGGMCLACLSLALSFLLKEHGWLTFYSPYLAFIGISIFSASYPIGMGGIPYVIMSEIFPINIKGAAGSLAIVVSYLSDLIVSYSFNFMMGWSASGKQFIFEHDHEY
ncbi:hypothetical protein KSS87_023588 [Heliosperma pusillum]|nr:hypothetical protein KSS87_023588 [Heliosperma pusillum]